MNKKNSFILLLLVLFVTGCKSVPGSKEKVALNGMIYDTENRPVVNYRIYIDGKGLCTSDIGGRFFIDEILKGEHVFLGFGEGYLSIEEKVVVYDKSQILYLRVPAIETKLKEAFSCIKQEQYEKAESVITEVLKSDEDNEDALFFMSVIKHLQGENQEAEKYLNEIKLAGGFGVYEKELEKIISAN